jgi:hypothetical protein
MLTLSAASEAQWICRRQIARSVASRQLLGVAPIGLHAVAGLHRDQ